MTSDLLIGDYAYSSWSLRGWLMFDHFGVPVRTTMVDFASGDVAEQLTAHAPARTVPTFLTPDGVAVSDSLAIAEEVASRFPEADLWPADPAARAMARTLAAEMHSGFAALRQACPMNLRTAYRDVPVSAEVQANLDRIEVIWGHALDRFGGPWLCGAYSAADAFYAPVAARIAGYRLTVGPVAAAYVAAHLADPSFRRWRAMGLVRGATLARYARDYPQVAWPGPAPLAAKAVESGVAENAGCLYSGKPVTHLLEAGGRVFGFCNAFCRDKTVADPLAWPAFAKAWNRT
jgi:glutathione S-transferase